MPYCNADSLQLFLDHLSQLDTDQLSIVVLDNGAFHHAKKLQIPDNISLLFLPPYSPELNPAKKMWQRYKSDFTNKFFKTLDDLSDYIQSFTQKLNPTLVKSTCAYEYITADPFWTNL